MVLATAWWCKSQYWKRLPNKKWGHESEIKEQDPCQLHGNAFVQHVHFRMVYKGMTFDGGIFLMSKDEIENEDYGIQNYHHFEIS